MRLSTGILGVFAAALLVFASACGGGDKGDSGGSSSSGGGGGGDSKSASISEKEADTALRNFIVTTFGVFTGAKKGQDLIDVFAPECRTNVKASDVDLILGFVRAFVPDLAKAKIDDVDLGKLKLEQTADGVKAVPADPNSLKIKVDGKFVDADTYFKSLGFDSSDELASTDEPILLVKRDGKVYVGDCADLQDLSDPFGTGGGSPSPVASGTPRPTSTPTR